MAVAQGWSQDGAIRGSAWARSAGAASVGPDPRVRHAGDPTGDGRVDLPLQSQGGVHITVATCTSRATCRLHCNRQTNKLTAGAQSRSHRAGLHTSARTAVQSSCSRRLPLRAHGPGHNKQPHSTALLVHGGGGGFTVPCIECPVLSVLVLCNM
jgi:hypothetical protein